MKRMIIELIAFALFILSLGCIIGTAGSLELDYITMGQAATRLGIGLIVFGVDAVLIIHLQNTPEIKRLTRPASRSERLQK